ncbi:uncharacterized protein VTP21DRAFT_3114 [Calcarisporiella thermophila]|uniref:uncharacterized protein n=1 Tax=Calcarisporiella thermophila TaxID=911321 RepID=UPI00374369A0
MPYTDTFHNSANEEQCNLNPISPFSPPQSGPAEAAVNCRENTSPSKLVFSRLAVLLPHLLAAAAAPHSSVCSFLSNL